MPSSHTEEDAPMQPVPEKSEPTITDWDDDHEALEERIDASLLAAMTGEA